MGDYKHRIIDEYKELKERANKLGTMISHYYAGTLYAYLKILEQRAEIEGIEL